MYEFCRRYTGGSLSAACHMNQGLADVTVNWAGGLHHSKKAEASVSFATVRRDLNLFIVKDFVMLMI